jgi:uncharacterized protein YfkK (UPF0435 family)
MQDVIDKVIDKVNFVPQLKHNSLVELKYMTTEIHTEDDDEEVINVCQHIRKELKIVDGNPKDYDDNDHHHYSYIRKYIKEKKNHNKVPVELLQAVDERDQFVIECCNRYQNGKIILGYKIIGQVNQNP